MTNNKRGYAGTSVVESFGEGREQSEQPSLKEPWPHCYLPGGQLQSITKLRTIGRFRTETSRLSGSITPQYADFLPVILKGLSIQRNERRGLLPIVPAVMLAYGPLRFGFPGGGELPRTDLQEKSVTQMWGLARPLLVKAEGWAGPKPTPPPLPSLFSPSSITRRGK